MPKIESLVNYGGHKVGKKYNVNKTMGDALVKLGRARYLTKDMVSQPVTQEVTPLVAPTPPVAPPPPVAMTTPEPVAAAPVSPPPAPKVTAKSAPKPKQEDAK